MYKTNSEILKELEELKQRIVSVCKVCSGAGYLITADKDITCQCMAVLKYLSRLMRARIPSLYWQLHLDTLFVSDKIKKLLNTYLENFDNALVKHKGIMFGGNNGTGKTSLLCEIGKQAIIRKKNVFFFTFEQYQDALYKDNVEFFDNLKKADVHLFDEFGKGHIKADSAYIPIKIESYVKDMISEKVICFSTNFTEQELKDMFGDSFFSVLHDQTLYIPVTGDDYRPVKQNDWIKELKTVYNYYHEHIVSYAKNFID